MPPRSADHQINELTVRFQERLVDSQVTNQGLWSAIQGGRLLAVCVCVCLFASHDIVRAVSVGPPPRLSSPVVSYSQRQRHVRHYDKSTRNPHIGRHYMSNATCLMRPH